jgi:uncharacterized protein RhaS with RHS repeats
VANRLRRDPIGLAGGVNPFAYVLNNPVLLIDPTGLDSTTIINTSGGRSMFYGLTNGNWGGMCWSGGQYLATVAIMGISV